VQWIRSPQGRPPDPDCCPRRRHQHPLPHQSPCANDRRFFG
jgi:hypothetical protein